MKIAVIGLGLIGGSIAKALKAFTDHEVLGADLREEVECRAMLVDAIDQRLTLDDLGQCDMVFLAVYPQGLLDYLRENGSRFKPGAVVLDTCGVKCAVCPEAERIAKENGFVFIGAHPMAGVEHAGFNASQGDMFQGASMILTPPTGTPIQVVDQVKQLCLRLGFAQAVITTPEHHDAMIAYTSQLAHVVSSAYVRTPKALEHRGFSAGSYHDMTRVATLDENLWTELFLDNQAALTEEVNQLISRLTQYRDAIAQGDRETLHTLLREGRLQKLRADGKEL